MLQIRNLTKVYRPKNGVPVVALNDVSIDLEDKGMVFILGKSGSGKSTFLNVLGGLDKYDKGEIIINGKSSKDFSQGDFDSYRNTYLGFIFQEYNILNEFSVGKNIGLAMELQGKKATPEALDALMASVDLQGYANRRPNELSGGQKQRVAIARALIKDPEIIMADEPTGALDSNTGRQVFETLKKLSSDKLVLIVSHDREYAEYYGDRVIEFADGKIISDITKYKAEAEKTGGLSIIDNSIIHIKQGYTLQPKDLETINAVMAKKSTDTFISLDQRANREFKRIARIDNDGNKESFANTTLADVKRKSKENQQFKLIKSHFPIGTAIKMGASSLKSKPVRLIIAIFLAVVSLILFGLADTMGAYKKIDVTVKSMRDSNINYISMTKGIKTEKINWNDEKYFDYDKENMNDADVEKLFQQFGLNFVGVNDFPNGASFGSYKKDITHYSYYYKSTFAGFVGLTPQKFEQLEYSLVDGESKYPTDSMDVAISIYIYEHFKEYGWKEPNSNNDNATTKDINTYDDLVGRTIPISDNIYTISGIIDTKFDSERYSPLKESQITSSDYFKLSELEELIATGPHALAFFSEGGAKQLIENAVLRNYGNNYHIASYYVDNTWQNGNNAFSYYRTFKNIDIDTAMYNYFGSKTGTLKDDEALIPYRTLYDYASAFLEEKRGILVEEITELEDYCRILFYRLYPENSPTNLPTNDEVKEAIDYFTANGFTIPDIEIRVKNYGKDEIQLTKKSVGWFYEKDPENPDWSYIDAVYITKSALDEFGLGSDPYSFALANAPSSDSVLKNIVTYSYDESEDISFFLHNSVMPLLLSFNSQIEMLSRIFLYMGLGFALFSALMLMNFITTSISYKKREIGILRAIGAKSSNVFSIFFSESVIIALINWVLATIGTFVLVMLIGNLFRNQLGLQITLLIFSVRQVALILAVSLVTAFLASLLPVYRIARKKPIDAIQNR